MFYSCFQFWWKRNGENIINVPGVDMENLIKESAGYHKRCKQCAYDESVTANTVFHGMHPKAFYMIFRLTTQKKGMSTVEPDGEVKLGS